MIVNNHALIFVPVLYLSWFARPYKVFPGKDLLLFPGHVLDLLQMVLMDRHY